VVRAKVLSPQEAIGDPEHKDYPIITGRERIIQAEFRDSFGHAFTDMFGDFTGRAVDIAGMELLNNFRRAVFISSLNAVMRYLGLIDRSLHCRDDEPVGCSEQLIEYIAGKYGSPKIAMVGLQPRMVEALSKSFETRVTDLDSANIGSEAHGVMIRGPEHTAENLEWCDIGVVTGSTIVNSTLPDFLISKPVVFYGVTVAGAARVLGLESFCPSGR
jgi:hypothetical protein